MQTVSIVPHTIAGHPIPGLTRREPTPQIEQLRAKIDRIDTLMVALVEERLDHAAAIARAKGNSCPEQLLIRPERERQVVARLQARASDRSADAVAGLWRELMAQSLQVQQTVELLLHAEREPMLVTDRTRQRFGCAAPLSAARDAEDALRQARSRPVIAIIELNPLSDWWVPLHDDPSLQILDGIRDASGRLVALAIGRISKEHIAAQNCYVILTEQELRRQMDDGAQVRALALSGGLRLCMRSHGEAA